MTFKCEHTMSLYEGLTQRYEYCSKCGTKECDIEPQNSYLENEIAELRNICNSHYSNDLNNTSLIDPNDFMSLEVADRLALQADRYLSLWRNIINSYWDYTQ